MQSDGQIGFFWVTADGVATTLPDLVIDDDEPDRLVATHLEALDDALIIAAARFGQLLGGGKMPNPGERDDLVALHRSLDRLVRDYGLAADVGGIIPDVRAGKIIGTATLFSIRARLPLGLLGSAPFDGELDEPELGVVSGFGQMASVDDERPWMGGRWILKSESGQRYPLTLSTMLFDSSGVNKDAARKEHREAIEACVAGAGCEDADPFTAASALDWLLYDWLMAHRENQESAAIEIPKSHESDAAVIVRAACASVGVRSRIDPGLASPLPTD